MEDGSSVYIYNGVDEVPEDVTHVRVDPSVTVIPAEAFKDRGSLELVDLQEGLIRIENKAFKWCISLKRINIPSTVREIGEEAFDGCDELDGITLPEELQRLGQYAFKHCRSLQTINIPPNIENIQAATFICCDSLLEVLFSEGLREIGEDAFSRCKSLVSVTFPSSLKVICKEAFEGCKVLDEVHIPDSLQSIETGAFKNCDSLTNFRIPPMSMIDISIIKGNNCLVSLELSENTNIIGQASLLASLRNIALPTECEIDADAFHNCTDLRVAFPDADTYDDKDTTITEALQHRFDNLPIHKICYYQSYSDNETTMQHLKREINPWTSKPPSQLNTTGKQQDCLGMTPLHILACSTKPTIEMYRLLIEKYPETLIMKDKWGDIPLLYAIQLNDAPMEVFGLLVESYKTLHPGYEFDWKGMILTLVRHNNVPLMRIQTLVNAQRNSFPKQEYDMQQVVMELASYDASQCPGFGYPYTSVDDTVKYLLRVSINKRLDLLDVSKWRVDLDKSISDLGLVTKEGTQAVYDQLAAYEIAKEATSVLELALWKKKIDESRNKRARVDSEISYREQCRINCGGADIIIRNVLPYLLPNANEMTISVAEARPSNPWRGRGLGEQAAWAPGVSYY